MTWLCLIRLIDMDYGNPHAPVEPNHYSADYKRGWTECLLTFQLRVQTIGVTAHVYLHPHDSIHAAWCGLNNYFNFYNEERLYTSLNTKTRH